MGFLVNTVLSVLNLMAKLIPYEAVEKIRNITNRLNT